MPPLRPENSGPPNPEHVATERMPDAWTPVPDDFFEDPRVGDVGLADQAAYLALAIEANHWQSDGELSAHDLRRVAVRVRLGHSAWPNTLNRLRTAGLIEDRPDGALQLTWVLGLSRQERLRRADASAERQWKRRHPGVPWPGPRRQSRATSDPLGAKSAPSLKQVTRDSGPSRTPVTRDTAPPLTQNRANFEPMTSTVTRDIEPTASHVTPDSLRSLRREREMVPNVKEMAESTFPSSLKKNRPASGDPDFDPGLIDEQFSNDPAERAQFDAELADANDYYANLADQELP